MLREETTVSTKDNQRVRRTPEVALSPSTPQSDPKRREKHHTMYTFSQASPKGKQPLLTLTSFVFRGVGLQQPYTKINLTHQGKCKGGPPLV